MPGKITQSGNAVNHGDTLVWKLSSYRMIPAGYLIEAESRTTNIWAFVITGLLIIFSIGTIFWKAEKR